MDDAVALEEHREATVVPARDRRLLRRASAHRGMAGGRRAKLLLDLVHGEAALRTIELRLAQLQLIVDHEGFGNSSARGHTPPQQCGQNAGLHATTLLVPRGDYNTAGNLPKRATLAARETV